MRLHVDTVCPDYVIGWAVGAGGIRRVVVSADGAELGTAETGLVRQDVADGMPGVAGAGRSGFLFRFQDRDLARPRCTVRVTVEAGDGARASQDFAVPTVAETAPAGPLPVSPFPAGVHGLLAAIDPAHAVPGPWTASRSEAALADVLWLARHGRPGLGPLNHYLLYLAELNAVFASIERRFPRLNARAQTGGKDLCCVASRPEELLCIANHLYVLWSRGLGGAFTEFGCFKGFSSACLSHACHALGVAHHVFDSFSGLPPSESAYYADGEFAGALEEVRHNVASFGRLAAVRFHRGYFAETLPRYDGEPMLIWMDVDLRASAQDVMQLLPRLPQQSAVFTHECRHDSFAADGAIRAELNEDDVLTPIWQAFGAAGRPAAGAFVVGNTGVVWDRDAATPPLGAAAIARLVRAA